MVNSKERSHHHLYKKVW